MSQRYRDMNEEQQVSLPEIAEKVKNIVDGHGEIVGDWKYYKITEGLKREYNIYRKQGK